MIETAAIPSGTDDPAAGARDRGPLRLKVCGMTDLQQLHQLGMMGVAFAGLIFYHKSPRFVLRHLTGEMVRRAKLKVYKVGVFVNASYEEIMNQVEQFGLDLVQLHGDETPRFCEQVSSYIQTIKAFRIGEDENIPWKIREYTDACDMYLFDTMGAGYGGTGKKFSWHLLQGLNIGKPFFLSGGIEPGDVAGIREFIKNPVAKDLFALDVNSKFETRPGVKDMELLRQFITDLQS
ncbi:MAG TPA: phosphoribosylanthranilate isomerase [Lacibacter sp.]|nr:phosphoribosylanthranilate isomerase [Lacibacter sp.]HMO88945.1 phosphoribosylanthranilate isomerase [Lacibacter sp.]HMP87236.1 phosphoribosylanthranilate isomerase [Lacibacter sp.]